MNIEAPSLQHLSSLPASTPHLDVGLLQPLVFARIGRHLPDLHTLTMMVVDAAALDGPPLTAVKRLRLVQTAGLAKLWPRLVELLPAVEHVDLMQPRGLTTADLDVLAAHGITGLGVAGADTAAAPALGHWPTLRRLALSGVDLDAWLAPTDDGIVDLELHAAGGPGVAAALKSELNLDRLALFDAGDLRRFEPFAAFDGLRALHLHRAPHLSGSPAKLRSLDDLAIVDSGLTGDGLVGIARLDRLEHLRLDGCVELEGAVLGLLCRLPNLGSLDISGCTRVEADDLRELEASPVDTLALRGLQLSGGIGHLHTMTALTRLDIRGCEPLTDDDVAELAVMRWLVRLDADPLQWTAGLAARKALFAALGPALSHYRWTTRDLPDGVVEEHLVHREAPWHSEQRVDLPAD